MPFLAPILPFVPLLAAGLGAGTALYSGAQANRRNEQALGQANQATAQQQQLIAQLMGGISPESYRAQAYQDGQSALGQLSSNFAQRGMLSSGALHTAGAQTLSGLYANASAKYQQDRQNAIGMALGGQQAVQRQYGAQINPEPWSGLGAALGGIGTAAGAYLHNNKPAAPSTGAGLPGFGVSYR